MTISNDDEFAYYSKYGIITNPGACVGLLDNLPADITQLCGIIQGLLLHVFWAERYGEKLSEARTDEAGIRHVEQMLARLGEIDDRPIVDRRPLDRRLIGNCRTFSVLLAAMLQSQGRPARARCGFGRYFNPGWYEDHWICEYWNDEKDRWIMVDAQLDEFQIQELKVRFDPGDVPKDQFIVGGKAWLDCRTAGADPGKYGIFDMRGSWFIRGNLVRDIAALNKVELLPWDGWGLIDFTDEQILDKELLFLDRVAALTVDAVDFSGIRRMYASSDGLTVPQIIKSYTQSGTIEIDLAA